MKLALSQIKTDAGTQARAGINQGTVDEYAKLLQDGVEMPAVVVVKDGDSYLLCDGFHRYFAHEQIGKQIIDVEVVDGNLASAIHFATAANAHHGLRMNGADKRRAIQMCLKLDKELNRPRSDRDIGRHIGVGHALVGEVRKEMGMENGERIVKRKDGKTYTIKTGNIGKTPPPPEEDGDNPPPPPEDSLVDDLERPVTDPAVFAAFHEQVQLDDVIKAIGTLIKKVDALRETPIGAELRKSITTDLHNAMKAVEFAKPYTTCPYAPNCENGCKACDGRKWVTKEIWERIPEEIKRTAMEHAQ